MFGGLAERSSRLVAIDALRGVAVLAVLLSHLNFRTEAGLAFPRWLAMSLEYGAYGVNLFLVLSGFCIHMAWARAATTNTSPPPFTAFWKRRLRRLYPPYFVALVLTVAGLYVFHGILRHEGPGLVAKLGYTSGSQLAIDLVFLVLLLQNLNEASDRVGNGPFWSLALEEQLYMLYFPLLWLRRTLGWPRTLLIVFAVTVVFRGVAASWAPDQVGIWFKVGPARWFEWALGAAAVEVHLKRVKVPWWLSSAPVGLLLLGGTIAVDHHFRWGGSGVVEAQGLSWGGAPFVIGDLLNDSLFGIAFFILMNAACAGDWGKTRAAAGLAWVGVFSYSLYLTHQLSLVPAKEIALRLGLGTVPIAVARVVVPIGVGWLYFKLIERHFLTKSRTSRAP